MKWERTERFHADYRRLNREQRRLFRIAVQKMNAEARLPATGGLPTFPDSLRIESLSGAPGVYAMTWSFSGPDGRATFEYVTIDGELGIRWRQIGDHRIYDNP